jgi:hypothetical protein
VRLAVPARPQIGTASASLLLRSWLLCWSEPSDRPLLTCHCADNADWIRFRIHCSAGSGLLFHAGAGVQSGSQRLVKLPRKLRVRSEWGDDVCKEPCSSFLTDKLGDGESTLYWVSANGDE